MLEERRTRDRKVASSNLGRSSGENFLLQSTLLTDPRDTAVARKRPRSFCPKCRWQVIPKHAYTLEPNEVGVG